MGIHSDSQTTPVSHVDYPEHNLPACLMVNMPDSVVTTKEDYPQHINFQLPEQYKHVDWHHLGPVSEHSQGLIILTDSREFANRLESIHLPVKFYALVTGQITPQDVYQFQEGIAVDGTVIPADLQILQAGQQESKVEVQISQGGSRDLTRMFAQISKPVKELIRIAMGPVKLEKTLMPSDVRPLNVKEIQQLSNYLH